MPTQVEMSEKTKAALRQVAIDCLCELGYAKTTGVEIARRAGVTQGLCITITRAAKLIFRWTLFIACIWQRMTNMRRNPSTTLNGLRVASSISRKPRRRKR